MTGAPDTELAPAPARRLQRPRFSLAALGLLALGGALSLAGAFLVRQALFHRLESSEDLALSAALAVLAVLQLGVGVLAARVARSLCFFELLTSVLVWSGVLLSAWALAGGAGGPLYGLFMGVDRVLVLSSLGGVAAEMSFFAFLGSSLGFMFLGGGQLDLGFGYELFVAVRHLLSRKRSAFLPVITVISVVAVALGVAALIIVLSVMSGFEADLKAKILGTNAHAVVLKYATPFRKWDAAAEKVAAVEGVTGVAPFVLNQVMIASGAQVDGAMVKGLDPERAGQVSDLPKNISDGELSWLSHPEKIPLPRLGAPLDDEDDLWGDGDEGELEGGDAPPAGPLPAVALGTELARNLRVFVGDVVNVMAFSADEVGPTGPIPRTRAFRVGAVVYTGMYEYDAKFAYIHLSEAQSLFDMDGAVTGLELKTDDLDGTRRITHTIKTRLEGYPYYTKDWGEMNRNLFAALKLEKLVMAIILAIIVLVASFIILSTLFMMVMEKGHEIAILKSMGARDGSIMKIFVLEGLMVGVAGTLIGLGVGLGTCAIIASGLIRLDPEVYYISSLPVLVDPLQVFLVAVTSIVLCYAATIYPSVTASRIDPVEGLRND